MVRIIAIDGPASAGKTTIAKKIANFYSSPILHSGRLYRAVAFEIINKKIKINDKKKILRIIKLLNDKKLETAKLYSSEIDKISSVISAKKYVRNKLMCYQRNFPKIFAKHKKFAIVEGRDIGSVIFPKANYKIFLWADAKIRAKRRFLQITKNGEKSSLKRIYEEIVARDTKDLNRKVAPLRPAANSFLLDTSYLDIEQVFDAINSLIQD